MSLDKLPTEMLISILENLDYFDLHLRIPLVNKRFHDLLKDVASGSPTIDSLLFRDSPLVEPLQSTFFPKFHPLFKLPKFHPLFKLLEFDTESHIRDVRVHYKEEITGKFPFKYYELPDGCYLYDLIDCAVRNNNATSPPVKYLRLLMFNEYQPVFGSGFTGAVTVFDAIEAIYNYFEQEIIHPNTGGKVKRGARWRMGDWTGIIGWRIGEDSVLEVMPGFGPGLLQAGLAPSWHLQEDVRPRKGKNTGFEEGEKVYEYEFESVISVDEVQKQLKGLKC